MLFAAAEPEGIQIDNTVAAHHRHAHRGHGVRIHHGAQLLPDFFNIRFSGRRHFSGRRGAPAVEDGRQRDRQHQ